MGQAASVPGGTADRAGSALLRNGTAQLPRKPGRRRGGGSWGGFLAPPGWQGAPWDSGANCADRAYVLCGPFSFFPIGHSCFCDITVPRSGHPGDWGEVRGSETEEKWWIRGFPDCHNACLLEGTYVPTPPSSPVYYKGLFVVTPALKIIWCFQNTHNVTFKERGPGRVFPMMQGRCGAGRGAWCSHGVSPLSPEAPGPNPEWPFHGTLLMRSSVLTGCP